MVEYAPTRTIRPWLSLALGLGVGAAVLAQATAPVATDAAPPPAEDRMSTGAVVLQDSLVRAQKANEFQRSAAQTGVGSVGRGVLRATRKAQAEADLAQTRDTSPRGVPERGAP